MRIHREGYKTLTLATVLLLGSTLLLQYLFPNTDWVYKSFAAVGLVIFIIILQFFRNPERKTQAQNNEVIAPADGKVVVIEEVEEKEYFKDKRIQVSIFMSPFNVHVNRNPISGEVSFAKYHKGKYLVAWHPKSSEENERTTVVIKNNSGTEVLFRQIAGALARRICYYIKPGDQVKQGDEMGFIKFGSRVDLFFPLGTEITVKLNEVTRGGESVIAKLKS